MKEKLRVKCHIRLHVVSVLPGDLWLECRATLNISAEKPRTGAIEKWLTSGGWTELHCDQCYRSFIPYFCWRWIKDASRNRTFCHHGNIHNTTTFNTKLLCVWSPNHPDLLRSASPSSDHCGGHPALLPPGNQCLDRSHRHCCVGTSPVFCGHQVVPNAEEHLGEYSMNTARVLHRLVLRLLVIIM